jgi:hypothetical protein
MSLGYENHSDDSALWRRTLKNVFGEDGFSTAVSLRPDELAELRRLVTESWLGVISEVAPEAIDQFASAGIEEYHHRAHMIDHANIWTTQRRTFSPAVVDIIRGFSIFGLFDRECPGYCICSEMPPYGDLNRARINWRLVRPGDGVDLGPIHADYWFEAVMDGWSPAPAETIKIKIWVPIYLEQGLTGFAYLPGSHRQQLRFGKKLLADGHYKPHFEEIDLPAPLQTMDTPCGNAVIFNYNLVHRGANSHKAKHTRVSMEVTLLVPRRSLEERYGDLSAFY